MAETVTMPKLGFDMAEGTLVRWVVAEGEEVAKGGVLAEIETDKATVEVESTVEGVVHRHLVAEGDIVPVGTPIAMVGVPGEDVEEQVQGPPAEELAEAGEAGPGAFTPRELGEGSQGGTPSGAGVIGGVKPKGDRTLEEVGVPEGKPDAGAAPEDGGPPGGLRASPVARRMADENGIDLKNVVGSGPQGRIVKKDIEAFLEKGAAAAPVPEAAPAPAPAPAAGKRPMPAAVPSAGEDVPLSRLRAAIGRRMVEAKQQVPHFYVTYEYDMAAVMDLRQQINNMLPEGEKLSVNDFIVKAAALALREFPNLNASFNGDKIVRHGQVNIGNAVAVENGLLTVVCREADRKTLRQISSEVRSMAGRAREGRVKPDDIEGSTFSISNLGMFDVEDFIAIINPPEAAILAVGSARAVPVVKDGEIKPGLRMKATISVDHRVSDGAEAARFMQALAAYLEQPLLMM